MSYMRERAAAVKTGNIPGHLDSKAVTELIRRLAGDTYASKFTIKHMEGVNGLDSFELSQQKDNIEISAILGIMPARNGPD